MAPILVQKRKYGPTGSTLNYNNSLGNKAVEVWSFSNAQGDRGAVHQQVVDELTASNGGLQVVENGNAIPLDTVRVRFLNFQNALARLRFEVPSWGAAQSGRDGFGTRTATESTRWIELPTDGFYSTGDEFGFPKGEAHQSIGGHATAYTFPFPVLVITLTVTLPFNPAGTIQPYYGEQINESQVSFGDVVFPPKTLRFDGADIEPEGDDYSVVYQWSGSPAGRKWVEQRRTDTNTIATLDRYAARSFEDPGFPVA